MLVLGTACNKSTITTPCHADPNPDLMCTMQVDPVCGCDNVVYSNSCVAEQHGIVNVKLTNKAVGASCNY